MRRAAALVLGAATVAGCGGDNRNAAQAPPERPAQTQEAPAPKDLPLEPVRRRAAVIVRRTQMRAAPGGRVLQVLSRRTRFNGRQQVAVVARRGAWLGVLHPASEKGRAGWIPADAATLVQVPYEIAIDRSARIGRVRRHGKVVRRFPVAVGRASSPTPLGRYAVTDLLRPNQGSPYGCCILALSARQKKLPQGWAGGTRVALHGSPTDQVGGGVSAGCVRLRRRDLQWLFRRAAAGSRVEIVA